MGEDKNLSNKHIEENTNNKNLPIVSSQVFHSTAGLDGEGGSSFDRKTSENK